MNTLLRVTCRACGRDDNDPQPDPHRRRALFRLFAGLLLTQVRPAKAGDDLLDPGKIGAAGKSVEAEGLLDPSSLGAKAAQSAGASTRPSANRQPASYARGMAGSVVSSMDSLTRAAATLVDEAVKLDTKGRELAKKLQTLKEEMASKLAEYRLGLFCSGCGQTKSEILAKGETFPHSGQSIIRPTPEQIAAKERAMQVPIDQTSRELRDNRAKQAKAVGERDEAMLQIEAGLALWRTSITFENALILQDEHDKEVAYKAERAKAEAQVVALNKAHTASAKPADVARDIQKWADIKGRLEVQRVHQRRATQDSLASAASMAQRDCDELNVHFSRGTLSQLTTLVATTAFVSSDGDFNGLGGLYRMGSYSLSGHDEVLPRVNTFIADFRNSPRYGTQRASSRNGVLPTPEVPLTQQLRNTLKDLLKCDPGAGENCAPPRRNVPTGVRG